MERVGSVLQGLQGQANLPRRLSEARAIERWPEIVGSHLAVRTRPLRVADGRLFVLARGAALRQELTFHAHTIARKFNAAASTRIVREVVFLETDALEGSSAFARAPVAPAEPERSRADREAEAGGEPAGGEEEQEEESSEPDVGAMYEPFDAEAYRRRLRSIGRESIERQES